MNALVTGGAGFIGSHLVHRLLSDGHTVSIIDRFHDQKKKYFTSHYPSRCHLYTADITVASQIHQDMFKQIDCVFHLIATKKTELDPVKHHTINVDGTIHLLEASRKAGVRKFIYTGAASCYGIPKKNPVKETTALDLTTTYAFTKYAAEQYVMHWGMVYKLPILILRLFNAYGPQRMPGSGYGPTLSVFLRQKEQGVPFTVIGDGRQKRDFTYISDVVDAYVKAAESGITQDIINIGTGRPRTVKQMLQLLGGKSIFLQKRTEEPACIYPDVQKAKKLLGWQANVGLEEGIQRVLHTL